MSKKNEFAQRREAAMRVVEAFNALYTAPTPAQVNSVMMEMGVPDQESRIAVWELIANRELFLGTYPRILTVAT